MHSCIVNIAIHESRPIMIILKVAMHGHQNYSYNCHFVIKLLFRFGVVTFRNKIIMMKH